MAEPTRVPVIRRQTIFAALAVGVGVLAACSSSEESTAIQSVDIPVASASSALSDGGNTSGPSSEKKPVVELTPTSTCGDAAIAELHRVEEYVVGRSWTQRSNEIWMGVIPETETCRVHVRTNQLNETEEAKLLEVGGTFIQVDRVEPPKR